MTPALTAHFTARPSFQAVLVHRLFPRMARNPLNSDQLINFLVAMGDFCAHSQSCLRLPKTLRELGHTESANAVERIAASKAGHGPQFERMAIELIYSSSVAWPIAPENRMGWEEMHDLMDQHLLEATREVIKLFASRDNEDNTHMPQAIGVMLAVEMITRESVILGEMMVFVGSRYYPSFTNDYAVMTYLREYDRDDEAVTWSSALMQHAVTGQLSTHREEILAGFDHACRVIATWYSAIEAVLFAKP